MEDVDNLFVLPAVYLTVLTLCIKLFNWQLVHRFLTIEILHDIRALKTEFVLFFVTQKTNLPAWNAHFRIDGKFFFEICTNYLLLLFFFILGKIMVLLRKSQMKIRPKCVQEYHDFQWSLWGFRISSKSFHVERN